MQVTDHAVDLERTLRDRFRLERFRPGQREVIEQVLARRDVLCVMPTGGGKSLCYQLPACLLEGLTLVVSPLIALMKDQVDALTARGISATLINSTLDPAEQWQRLADVEAGRYALVYVAPERFRSGRFVEAMARLRPTLLAVDEAHCISEWGHDFRPDYARLGQARRAMHMPPCIALTATATDIVRRDIAEQLDLRELAQFVTGFDRPNLFYRVVDASRDNEKLAALADILQSNPGSSIVYASSRKRCEDVGHFLSVELRKTTAIYHAGMNRDERSAAQESFMSGAAEVVVATNAFGMGVDKADIRSVVHYNMPGTLEAYYQEAGRAGRDSTPAECVLLYAPGDRFLQEMFIENAFPPPDAVYRVFDFLRRLDTDPIELTQLEIRDGARLDVNESAVGTALKLLEGAGALERFRPRENMAIVRINAEPDEPSLTARLNPQAHTQRIALIGLEGLVNRRFGEPVYFHPDELAASLGLERSALVRAIKNLVAELPIDYVPPFRGNAVRIIDRDRRARDLPIDFVSLAKRKNQEYEKLELMIQYSQARACRRSYILRYFGEASDVNHCGQCDNCAVGGKPKPNTAPCHINTDAGRQVVLKVLSGVARAKGRFGKTVIAQMLVGSNNEKVAKWGLTQLSTFGILAPTFKRAEVCQIIDSLAAAALVANQDVDRFRPIVALTERGWDYIRAGGQIDLALELPADVVAKMRYVERAQPMRSNDDQTPAPPAVEPGSADPLKERLRALRHEWARDAKLPPYCIFTNQTLDALVLARPRTPAELAAVKGLGQARIERYGATLLRTLADSPATEPSVLDPMSGAELLFGVSARGGPTAPEAITEGLPGDTAAGRSPVVQVVGSEDPRRIQSATATPRPTVSSPPSVPTEEWTWRLLDRGFTIDDAAEIRGLERSAIIRHATWMAHEGRPIPDSAMLSSEMVLRWNTWLGEHGETPPPPELGASADLWPLFLATRRSLRIPSSASPHPRPATNP
jgi:ATP-dependent DNA helicase RecQ